MQSSAEGSSSTFEHISPNSEKPGITKVYKQHLNSSFAGAVNGNADAQIFVNSDMTLARFIPGMLTDISFSEKYVGQHVSTLSTGLALDCAEDYLREVMLNGNVITTEITVAQGQFYKATFMARQEQPGAEITGAVITFTDITAFKNKEQELDKRIKVLRRINDELETFVYSVSHDLLGPVINIEGIINIINIDNENAGKETTEHISVLQTSVSLLRQVIEDMAVINKIENEVSKNEFTDLVEVIKGITTSIKNKINAAAVTITTDLEVTQIQLTKKDTRTILYNLIYNAIKFKSGKRTPEIIITTRALPGKILLQVQDNGIGIAEDDIPKIFEMYARVDKNAEGRGLGLYLVNKIVTAAGGKIEVESRLMEGTIFKLSL